MYSVVDLKYGPLHPKAMLSPRVTPQMIGLGLVVPNAPGYFGTFQISAYSAMVLYYPLEVVTAAGAAFVFLLYVVQMSLTLVGAAVALLVGVEPRAMRLPKVDGAPGRS